MLAKAKRSGKPTFVVSLVESSAKREANDEISEDLSQVVSARRMIQIVSIPHRSVSPLLFRSISQDF